MHGKVCDEIDYAFLNLTGATVVVYAWISNFIPHFLMVIGHMLDNNCDDITDESDTKSWFYFEMLVASKQKYIFGNGEKMVLPCRSSSVHGPLYVGISQRS